MQTTAVYGCVNLIARTISSLPLTLVSRETRENMSDLPLYLLLRDEPNPEMDSFQWWELVITHLELRGNAYIEIQRSGKRIVALWPLHPDRMKVERVDGRIRYTYQTGPATYAPIRTEDMLHIRLYSGGELKGISPIQQAANAIGLAIAAEDFSARYFDGDAMPRIALMYDTPLPPEAKNEIEAAWRQSYSGVDRSYRVGTFGNGARIEKIGIAPDDAQVLDQRKYQTVEICRIWNVPPHLIGELDRPTFNTVEQLDLDFGKHSIRPRLVRIERAMNRVLLSLAERKELYFEFNMEGLLRGDLKTRAEAYSTLINWGVLSPNDARDTEGLPPRPHGDEYLQPVNMVISGAPPKPDPAQIPAPTEPTPEAMPDESNTEES